MNEIGMLEMLSTQVDKLLLSNVEVNRLIEDMLFPISSGLKSDRSGPRDFTGDFEAARELIPLGYQLVLQQDILDENYWYGTVIANNYRGSGASLRLDTRHGYPTPALAVCAIGIDARLIELENHRV